MTADDLNYLSRTGMTVSSLKSWRRRVVVRDLGHRMTVHRSDESRGPIPWEVLQDAKDRTWGPDVTAVEVYPPAGRVVNELALRHLWRVPDGYTLPDLSNRRLWKHDCGETGHD